MIAEVLNTAFNTITPILLCVAVGAWFGHKFHPDPRTLARISLYVFLPPLVFESIATSSIQLSEIIPIGLTVVLTLSTMAFLGWNMARLQPELGPKTRSAFVLTVLLTNTGNFGLPFVEFAIGDAGMKYATIIVVFSAIVTNTLGIYIASSGSSSALEGLKNIVKNPLPYATALGFFFNLTHIPVPLPLLRTVEVLSNGAVPILVLLLGVQLSRITVKQLSPAYIRAIVLASVSRLFLPPFVVFLITRLTHVNGTAFLVLMLVMSMPTAVNSAVLSHEYGSDADFVTPVILLTTVGSALSLSILFTILMQ
ncbi:AEC family transporter [Phototrophicus methaneseepsis]|uniref:AEC family transporter n=1 Tax=Phototrophicus methaneseepsis TaxID=2710758 RepID=A0A7S8EBK9_9CHLR|nr:AEC family transporter [Phototrophicus methaneseepsis]QPC83946.1 AEC family transporter [Phototrophicus methaneseepsis]